MTPNIDISHLDIYANPYDIRRDLFWLMVYLEDREVKRTVYGNSLPKSEYKRICKFLKHPELMEDYDKDSGIWWIDYVDRCALSLGWIKYDTEGVYQSYSSYRPAFQDNYIETHSDKFDQFLNLSLSEQESSLFNHFQKKYRKYNPLMSRAVLGRLDSFDIWGAATKVLPTLDFGKSKTLVLEVLATLSPNTWYATSDLIQYMKENHPWFFIPEKTYGIERGGWRQPDKQVLYPRYCNFYEKRGYTRDKEAIADDDPLGFEKVEGRFIERFLENYLLTLGYVELAYSTAPYKEKEPMRGTLKAFRLNSIFSSVWHRRDFKAKVSVQPNFEIYIDAPVYPLATFQQLAPITDTVKEDKQVILKLKKQYVLHKLVEEPDFDLITLLGVISDTPLPQNVIMEIKEWTERTDVFTLYEGFGIYEGLKTQKTVDRHTETTIKPTIRLIRQPTNLYEKLKREKVVPLYAKHLEDKFYKLPTTAKTLFPTQKIEKPKKVVKKKITIQRAEWLTYTISNQEFYDAFLLVILKAPFLTIVDKPQKTLSFLKQHEKEVKTLLNDFKEKYQIKISKLGN